MPNIEDLPFMVDRLPLLRDGGRADPVSRKRATDPTMGPVREWRVLMDSLPVVRSQTMSCLEAVEGKGGTVSLKVCDRPKFDNIQQTIASTVKRIEALEAAFMKLDEIGPGLWLDDLNARLSSAKGIEVQQMERLRAVAAGVTGKPIYRGLGPEEALKRDEQYQRQKAIAESQIASAKAEISRLEPVAAGIREILESLTDDPAAVQREAEP
jgi:hypothetical protein